MTNKKIIIATRNSPLALWQAEYAADLITTTFPDVKTELLPMTTKGDRILDVTLNKIGGKGLFLKELEQAMQEGEADIAVHSMKDVPADMPEGFEICCVFKRHDASDAFVSNHYSSLDDLPQNSVVGTSSLRRQSQLLAIRPDLTVKPLRGNLQTRLRKLDEGEYDAIILATAGLERMNLDKRIKSKLKPNDWLPAVGQGAVGVECLSNRQDLKDLLSQLNHAETSECVNAERTMNQILNGSCSVAIGAYAQKKGDKLTMEAIVCAPDGTQIIRQKAESDNSQDLGRNVGRQLLADGAQAILDLGND